MNNRVELNITEEAAEGLISEKSMGAALRTRRLQAAARAVPARCERGRYHHFLERHRRPESAVPRPGVHALDALRRPDRAPVLSVDSPLARPFVLGTARSARLRRHHRLRVLPQRAARRPHQYLEPRARHRAEAFEILRQDGDAVSRVDLHQPARRSRMPGAGPDRAPRAQGFARQEQIQGRQNLRLYATRNATRSTRR